MRIFRWPGMDPFASLRYMQREMDRLLGGTFGEGGRFGGYPPVNIYSGADGTVVQCEVPGVKRENLDISITGDTLEIKGLKSPPADAESGRYRLQERGVGEFVRTVVLPEGVEADKVEAALTGGVLTVRVPKAPAAKPKQIEVK